jgi:hypothetical protein
VTESEDPDDPDRTDEQKVNRPAPPNTEDIVFPESFRKFWRTLLGPWGRR